MHIKDRQCSRPIGSTGNTLAVWKHNQLLNNTAKLSMLYMFLNLKKKIFLNESK
jgi:hypothetical protein